jgi:hypothetical protein
LVLAVGLLAMLMVRTPPRQDAVQLPQTAVQPGLNG